MIIDKFDNIRFYSCMLNNLENGLQAVEALRNPEAGKYADVQIVLEGSEEIAWADLGDLKEDGEYNGDNDKAAYTGAEDNVMRITAGMCYIAFPHDGHKAVRHTSRQQSYTKIVMKLPVVK